MEEKKWTEKNGVVRFSLSDGFCAFSMVVFKTDNPLFKGGIVFEEASKWMNPSYKKVCFGSEDTGLIVPKNKEEAGFLYDLLQKKFTTEEVGEMGFCYINVVYASMYVQEMHPEIGYAFISGMLDW